MKIKPRFKFKVTKGRMELANREAFMKEIEKLEGQEAYLTINQNIKDRSERQNRYYWGVVLALIGDELGYRADEIESRLHPTLAGMFLKSHVSIENKTGQGIEVETVKSTSSLSTGEFETYLHQVRMWAGEFLNINIPLPNEAEY